MIEEPDKISARIFMFCFLFILIALSYMFYQHQEQEQKARATKEPEKQQTSQEILDSVPITVPGANQPKVQGTKGLPQSGGVLGAITGGGGSIKQHMKRTSSPAGPLGPGGPLGPAGAMGPAGPGGPGGPAGPN